MKFKIPRLKIKLKIANTAYDGVPVLNFVLLRIKVEKVSTKSIFLQWFGIIIQSYNYFFKGGK